MQRTARNLPVQLILLCLSFPAFGEPDKPSSTTEGAAQLSPQLSHFEQLLLVRYNDSINTIEAYLGEPESRANPRLYRKQSSTLTLDYGTLGAIKFKGYAPNRPHKAKVGHIDYKVEGHLQESGHEFVKLVMASSNMQALSNILEHLYNADTLPEGSLQWLALRLERDIRTENDSLVNALSYVCLILAKQSPERYESLLNRVATDAAASKLRSNAKRALRSVDR